MAQLLHGSDAVESALSYVLGKNLENLTLASGDDVGGTGNALDNVLAGNAGSNLLDGKAGADTMAGGAGDDTLAFSDGDGSDTIEGFEVLSDDEAIDVSDFGFSDLSELSAKFGQNGLDTEIQLDEDDITARVEVRKADLQEDDFVI